MAEPGRSGLLGRPVTTSGESGPAERLGHSRLYPECAGRAQRPAAPRRPRPWVLGGRRSCSRRAVLLGARPARVERGRAVPGAGFEHADRSAQRKLALQVESCSPGLLRLARRSASGDCGLSGRGSGRRASYDTVAHLGICGRVPVWPPADTPSRRDVPVTSALTNVIVGHATSARRERTPRRVRLQRSARSGRHKVARWTQRVSGR